MIGYCFHCKLHHWLIFWYLFSNSLRLRVSAGAASLLLWYCCTGTCESRENTLHCLKEQEWTMNDDDNVTSLPYRKRQHASVHWSTAITTVCDGLCSSLYTVATSLLTVSPAVSSHPPRTLGTPGLAASACTIYSPSSGPLLSDCCAVPLCTCKDEGYCFLYMQDTEISSFPFLRDIRSPLIKVTPPLR